MVLSVPELESSLISTVSGVEELWAGSSSTSLPAQLPIPKMVLRLLQAMKFEVAGATNFLASRRSQSTASSFT